MHIRSSTSTTSGTSGRNLVTDCSQHSRRRVRRGRAAVRCARVRLRADERNAVVGLTRAGELMELVRMQIDSVARARVGRRRWDNAVVECRPFIVRVVRRGMPGRGGPSTAGRVRLLCRWMVGLFITQHGRPGNYRSTHTHTHTHNAHGLPHLLVPRTSTNAWRCAVDSAVVTSKATFTAAVAATRTVWTSWHLIFTANCVNQILFVFV